MPSVGNPLRRLTHHLLLALAVLLLAALAVPADGALAGPAGELSVVATRNLSVAGQVVGLVMEGPGEILSPTADPATAPQVVVHLYGPVGLEDVGKPALLLPLTTVLTPEIRPAPADHVAASPESAVVMAVLPAEVFPEPGAYLATVVYLSGEMVLIKGDAWFGRMVADREPLEIACVWPLVQGVHRDADGVFYDDWLERALGFGPTEPATTSPTGADAATAASAAGDSASSFAPGRLWDVLDLAGEFPDWRFTLAIEPILLTQLGEMAAGYSRADPVEPQGDVQEVGAEDERAASAGRFVDDLKRATASGNIGVLAAPYAAPFAAVLASQQWGDGAGQMRLGKQVVQQVLPLVAPVVGAFSPDLDLSTDGLSSFSAASVDHLLVDSSVAADLADPPAEGAVTARARDTESERLTLILADGRLRALMGAPWDVGLFCAGLAARATAPADALVLASAAPLPVPPLSFMRSLVVALAEVQWLKSVTLADVIGTHPPGSRPILLDRSPAPVSSYIELSLLDSIISARAAVAALGEVAGLSASGVTTAQLLLYTAESRWWTLPQVSPDVATVGLDYALRAQALAEGELEKMRVAGVDGTRVTGRSGVVVLRLENQADYPVTAQVRLGGDGVNFPDGSVLGVFLEPGMTELPVTVRQESGAHSLEVELLAGAQVIDEWSGALSFLTLKDYLPWALGGVALIGVVAGVFLVRRRRRLA